MTKQCKVGFRPDDYEQFKKLAFKHKKKIKDFFHEVVKELVKDEVV